MPRVRFIMGNEQVREIDAEDGQTILQIALDHGVPMESACGGNGFCTTCLCHVQSGAASLSSRNDREESMGIVEDDRRLGCQARVHGDITVRILES